MGYQKNEKIAIKANINGSGVFDEDTSGQTNMSYTNPVLLKALLLSLVEEAGVNPRNITVYDVSRIFPDYMIELCSDGKLQGIRFVGRNNGVAEEEATINWSYSFQGKVNYLPTVVTEADYLINLANLKGHSYGITLTAKNHFGSFINGNRMRPPEGANLHQFLTKGADILMNEPTVIKENSSLKKNPNVENYLHESGLISHAPSGNVYYDGFGNKVTNLGVHEHWNNSKERKYSRNLGKTEGIELVYIKK